MAVINRNSLVLLGVSVNRDVVTGTENTGINAATHKTTAIPFSMRRQSQGFPQCDQEPGQQQCRADYSRADRLAARAGRPGDLPCVLVGTASVTRAAWIRRMAWSPMEAGSCPSMRLCQSRLTAWQKPFSGKRSLRRFHASHRRVLSSRIPSRLLEARARKCSEADLARLSPAGGAPPASTRG
jgi:hypothetical protein